MRVEVVYARADVQPIVVLDLPSGSDLRMAIARSGLLERFPEIDLTTNKVGIFGRISPLNDILSEGDRIEIYRPLAVDPKQSRRQRASHQRPGP